MRLMRWNCKRTRSGEPSPVRGRVTGSSTRPLTGLGSPQPKITSTSTTSSTTAAAIFLALPQAAEHAAPRPVPSPTSGARANSCASIAAPALPGRSATRGGIAGAASAHFRRDLLARSSLDRAAAGQKLKGQDTQSVQVAGRFRRGLAMAQLFRRQIVRHRPEEPLCADNRDCCTALAKAKSSMRRAA